MSAMNKKIYKRPEIQVEILYSSGIICTSNNSPKVINKGNIEDDDMPTSITDGDGGWDVWGE